ncbi:septation protein A [Blastochloris viridis]|uniref:Inner membrane-spanning protein YciB n=1 Tax=Blastochloris viridis TaxID=1079 RepID=A0A0H5BEK7_BLAVI|nr:septation protein A [Blastochloris viridis]ALK07958.1 Intracellular septation protein [Blastochloris viridis]BAR98786.1 probable intracellular septation protein [Blastochloris viridis]CUU43880.1 Intracellular septation protein [Blastochloris viridis]
MTTAETQPARRQLHPLLKLALELGPLGLFFFANGRYGIFIATQAFMVAVVIALAANWLLARRLAVMPLVSGAVVLVFGTLTVVLQDDVFIKIKPTIINVLFGTVLLGGLAFGKPLLELVFDGVVSLTNEGWKKLTVRWALFFFVLAVLNEVVWRTQTTDFWVSFKVFGILPLTLVFSALQYPLMMRHALNKPK